MLLKRIDIGNQSVQAIRKISADFLFDNWNALTEFEQNPEELLFSYPKRIPMSLVRMSLISTFDSLADQDTPYIAKRVHFESPGGGSGSTAYTGISPQSGRTDKEMLRTSPKKSQDVT